MVSIDEFQQIAEYPENNVVELLRTRVQRCRHTWFIFAGSDRRKMEKIFNNPAEPFYLSCAQLYLDPINSVPFAKKHSLKSPSTVQSALRVLHDKGVLQKDGSRYCVANKLLGIWLKSEY